MSRRLAVCGLALLFTAACAPTNIAELVKAMGQDPASVCISVSVPGFGTVKGYRTNIVNGDITCDGDGLRVKSQATQLGVPITVVPQVQVGPAVTVPASPPSVIPQAPAFVPSPPAIVPPSVPPRSERRPNLDWLLVRPVSLDWLDQR